MGVPHRNDNMSPQHSELLSVDAARPPATDEVNGFHRPLLPQDRFKISTFEGQQSADWQPRAQLGPIAWASIPSGAISKPLSRSWSIERWLIARLLQRLGHPQVEVELWDGTVIPDGSASSAGYRLRIRQRAVLWKLLLNPAFNFPEGYARGQLEIEGDLLGLFCEVNRLWRRHPPQTVMAWFQQRRASRRRNTLTASLHNVEHHYNVGNEFYQLWLDAQLVYTCAYFPTSGMTLEAAQIAKMDHICRKLRLKPGETVIEAGCGWGALALHMARNYGVRVRACNISVDQLDHARRRADQLGVSDRVEFLQEDWRNLHGRCDAFVSVGMLEHVGPEHYPELGRVIERCMSPQGRGLLHTIGQNFPLPLNPWIERHIFPGAEPPALEQLARLFPAGDLTVFDVENLRLHYAETLWHWLDRFERSAETIRARYGDDFLRRWRLYLALSYSAFETGGLQLYQVLFAPAASNRCPRTRADWSATAKEGK